VSYDDIAAAYLTPLAEPIAAPEVGTGRARRLRDALEPIATQGWWSRAAAQRVTGLGLGFFDGYVWGRAAALGTPAPAVVAAAFGVFDPAMIGAVYEQGRSAAARDDVLAARADGAAQSLSGLASEAECAAVADPLLEALDAADGMGRALFSGLRGLPLPSTAAGRLWRAAELVREHRGDGHLAAAAAAGIEWRELNVLTELWLGFAPGEYSASRGMSAAQVGEVVAELERRGLAAGGALTAEGRGTRDRLEAATDTSQAALVAALGAKLDDVVSAAAAISDRVVAARAFPTDPRKRAAG
jgi:hypothetical protein